MQNHCARHTHQPQPDRQRVAQGLALLLGLELVVLADRPERRLVGPEVVEPGEDPVRSASSRSRARSPETRASWARAKIASVVSRPARTVGRAARSTQRSAVSRGTVAFAGPNSGHPRAEPARGTRGRDSAGSGRGQVLDQGLPERLLVVGGEPLQAGGAPPHLGQLVRLGLGPARLLRRRRPPWRGAGTGRAGGGSRRGAAATGRPPPAARGSTTRPSTAGPWCAAPPGGRPARGP